LPFFSVHGNRSSSVFARLPEEANTAASPKRAVPDPRQKEGPGFEWKLVGYADGLTLTLLKSVEHKDVEAQLNRLQSEGYYDGLAIYPIDASVPPPPSSSRHRGGNAPSRKGAARAKQSRARKDDAKRPAKRVPVRKKKAGSAARSSKTATARKARPTRSKKAKSAGKTKKKSRTKRT
jgi:hypothetical protein